MGCKMKESKLDNAHIEIPSEVLHRFIMNSEGRQDSEINLIDLWYTIWAGKWIIISITFLLSASAILYALTLPDTYRSEALLFPAEPKSGGVGGVASQLGGLASLAGVNLGGVSVDKTSLAIEIMRSRSFVFKFIEKYELTVPLMAVEGWNSNTNELLYNNDIYDFETKKWLNMSGRFKPSAQKSYNAFQNLISIHQNKDNSMITISIEYYSPYLAQKWVKLFIDAINDEMKARDLVEAKSSVVYLNKQLELTKVADFKNILYQLIEEQMKTIMFANVRQQYVLKTIDPDRKSVV